MQNVAYKLTPLRQVVAHGETYNFVEPIPEKVKVLNTTLRIAIDEAKKMIDEQIKKDKPEFVQIDITDADSTWEIPYVKATISIRDGVQKFSSTAANGTEIPLLDLKILYIHGLDATPESDHVDILNGNGITIVAPNLIYEKGSLFERLSNIIERENIKGVVGHSYGGYFAYHLSNKYKIPGLMFNPYFGPKNSLHPIPESVKEIAPYHNQMLILGSEDDMILPEEQMNIFKKSNCKIFVEKIDHDIPDDIKIKYFNKFIAQKKAADGKSIEIARINTPEFKQWFGYWDLIPSGKARKYSDNGIREATHGIRNGETEAINAACEFLSKQVTSEDVLIPIPNRTGGHSYANFMATEIAKRTGAKVYDGLRGSKRPSIYETKIQGKNPKDVDFGFYLKTELPHAKTYFIVDNVIGTGTTMFNAQKAVGNNAQPLVYSIDERFISKVVDSNGKPKIFYHGTTGDFSVLQRTNGEFGGGIYFGSNEDAGYFANVSAGYEKFGKQSIVPVYLNIKNPLTYEILTEKKPIPTRTNLIKKGYDGVFGYTLNGTLEVVAYYPNQVKSAIGNKKFSVQSDDILAENGASLDSKQFYISQRDKAVEELKITKDKSRIKSLDKKIKNYQLRIDYLNEVDWNNTGWGFDEAEDGKKIDSKKTALNWWRHTLSINEQNKFIEKYAPIYTPDYMRAVIYGEHNNTILEIWQKEGSPEWSEWLYETYGVGDLTDKYYTHTRSGGLWKRIHTNNTKAEDGAEIPVMDEEEYLSVNGASRQGFGDSALHKNRGGASDKTWTKIIDAQAQKDRELMALREKLRVEYAEKVSKGEIRPPSRYEKLISTAKGNPDREDVRAARRILEKHGKPNCDWDKDNQSCNYGCKITSPSTLTMGFEEFLVKLPDITSPFVGEEGVIYKAKYNRYSSRIDYFKHGRKNLTHTTTVGAYLHFIYDVYGVRFRDLSLDEKKALFGKYANRYRLDLL